MGTGCLEMFSLVFTPLQISPSREGLGAWELHGCRWWGRPWVGEGLLRVVWGDLRCDANTPAAGFMSVEGQHILGVMCSGEGLLCVGPWVSCLCESHFVTCKMGRVVPPSEDGVRVVMRKDCISQT